MNPPAIPQGPATVSFDKGLLTDCDDLPKLKSSTDTDTNDWIASVTKSYSACAVNKHKENVQIKKALNIP
jgi:hypothetical protein